MSYEAVYRAALECFHLGNIPARVNEAIDIITNQTTAPHVLMRPSISRDGDKWCMLYGENLVDGVSGFGDTIQEAAANFDKAWFHERVSKT